MKRSRTWVLGLGLLLSAVVGSVAPHGANAAPAPPGDVTFTRDIAPILRRSCENCHRADGVAPMSLSTYEEARPWARAIRQRTGIGPRAGVMPPWYVEKNIGIQKFHNDPSLSDAEITKIAKWVDSGAPMGNPVDMPPPRQFVDIDQWFIGNPDVIVAMEKPYVLPAAGPDNIVDVFVDPGFTEDM